MKELQALVAKAVADRGYRQGWTDEQYAARQICKAVEELSELSGAIQNPFQFDWMAYLEQAEFEARDCFDDKASWEHIKGVKKGIVAIELPDVLIPLLVLAETLGIDLEQAVREKVLGDVARGVRGEKPKGHVCNNCDGIDPDSCLFNPDRQGQQGEQMTAERLEEIGQYAALLFEQGNLAAVVIDELLAEIERYRPTPEDEEK